MPAAIWKIVIEQGVTWRTVVTVTDDTGAPVDLTGYAARMHVRETLDSPSPLLTLTSPTGGITLDPAAGRLVLYISDEQTAAIGWRYAVYDLEIESPGGDTSRLLKGEVEVSREVTR